MVDIPGDEWAKSQIPSAAAALAMDRQVVILQQVYKQTQAYLTLMHF